MSVNQSVGAKARWADCEQLAKVLGCGKTHVHDKLYSRLKREELVDKILDGNEAAVAAVRSWPEYEEPSLRAWEPEPKASAVSSKMEVLKLTMWFVGKVGGLEKARRALDFMERMEAEL